MIKLIDPSKEYLEQYKEAYLLSKEEIEKDNIKKHDMMFENPDEQDIVQKMLDNRDQSKLPSYYVPSYDYFIVDDDKFIGVVHIRIRLTESLLKYGGHIGYGINPKYWKQGYGTSALKIALEKSKNLIEDDNILLTCDEDNIGSYKVIENNGGTLENIVDNEDEYGKFKTKRYWIKKIRK